MTSAKPTYEELEQRIRDLEAYETKWKQSQQQLKESEEKFKVFSEQSMLAITIFSTQGFLFFNDAYLKMTEYSASDLYPMSFEDTAKMIHPDDREFVMEQGRKKMEGDTRTVAHYIYRGITKSGKEKWVEQFSKSISWAGQTADLLMMIDVTQRHNAEMDLKESEKRYRSLVNSIRDSVFCVDEKGYFTFLNKVSEKSVGITNEELSEKIHFLDLLTEDDHDLAKKNFEKLMGGKALAPYELKYQAPDGNIYVLEANAVPLYKENKIIGIMGVARDLTKRKQAEKRLKKQNAFIESILANLPIGIAVNRVPGMAPIYMNKKFKEIYGWSEQDIPDINAFFEKVYPGQEELKAEILADIESGDISRMNWTGVTATGSNNEQKVISAMNIPLPEQNLMISTVEDITRQHHAETQLRENEKFLNTIVENIPDMIFVKDAENLRFIRFNRAGEKLLGYSRDELFGKSNHDFFPKDEADFFSLKDREVLNSLEMLDIAEEPIQTRNMGQRILHTKKIPILDKENHPKYLLGISEDITDKKKMEIKLQNTQKMEAIATLAGGIAHQFNNALSVITGNLGLIKMVSPNYDDLIEYFSPMEKSVMRMAQLTRQLLAYARGGKYQEKEICLSDFIRNTLPILEHLLKPSISLETNLSDKETEAEIDETQMQMAMSAVLSNASDAIENTGRIQISCEQYNITNNMAKSEIGLSPGPYVRLTISDNGKGMDQETLKRVFEPFFTTKAKGRGLGLAAVYGITKNHNGWISVKSDPGKGTIVEILLPAIIKQG